MNRNQAALPIPPEQRSASILLARAILKLQPSATPERSFA